MSSRDFESSASTAPVDAEAEASEQGVYFQQEPGQQFRKGQAVTYEVVIGEDGVPYAVNIQIVAEPSVH